MSIQPHNPKLLADIAAGNEKAFEAFFVLYAPLVHQFILKHSDDKALADDILQDVFTKIWLTREILININNIHSYLLTIARNYAANIIRQKIRERRRHIEWQNALDETNNSSEKEALLNIIDRAIEQLPEQQRKTWILSRRQKMKYAEIAHQLGVSRETVKTNLQYANAGINKYLLANLELTTLLLLVKWL